MGVIDVTLRESVYYENALTNSLRMEYLKKMKGNIDSKIMPFMEIGYVDTESDGELCYDPQYISDAYLICKDHFSLVGMMHTNKADICRWDAEVMQKFNLIRIMVDKDDLEDCKPYIDYLHKLGIQVSINKIYAVNTSIEAIIKMEKEAAELETDYFYCADSSGSFTPHFTELLCNHLLENDHCMKVGLHLHDHMGLALANMLVANRCGVEMTDVAITGAGKGGGNLKMEYALPLLSGYDFFSEDMKNLWTKLNSIIMFFDELLQKDDSCDILNLKNYLTGVYKLNLKEIDRTEKEANGQFDQIVRLSQLFGKKHGKLVF